MRQDPSLDQWNSERLGVANVPRRSPVRYFFPLRDVLRSSGVDIAQLLAVAGIAPALFDSRENMLTPAEVENFIVAAKRMSGRDDLGFETGRRIKVNSHNLLGYGLISCPTVDEVLRMGSRHFRLIQETWSLKYQRNGAGGGECLYTPLVALSPIVLDFTLEALALAHQNHMQLLLGTQMTGYDIYLSMAEPAHIQRYQMLHPVRFHFDAGALPGVRVVMPAAMLDIPLALGDEEVMSDIDARCNALGQTPLHGDVAWTKYVLMMLREAHSARITVDTIAQRFQVSARTINRHLKKDGQSFRMLSDKVRFERACEMLRNPGATAVEVAQQLGFSDAPNFTRAFRRVMGVTPGEYQKTSQRLS